MKCADGKSRFIETWGALCTSWGVKKAMGQVHGYLLTQSSPVCASNIAKELDISSGSVSQSLNMLLDWGLIHRTRMPEVRKDHFIAEKDMWEVLRAVVLHRKERELEPLIKLLDEINCIDDDHEEDTQCFCQLIDDLHKFSLQIDSMLDTIAAMQSNDLIKRLFSTSKLASNPSSST